MSYNSNRRALLDASLPLGHRVSHARSCALHVANKLGVKREDVMERVAQKTGGDPNRPANPEELLAAFEMLESMRSGSD